MKKVLALALVTLLCVGCTSTQPQPQTITMVYVKCGNPIYQSAMKSSLNAMLQAEKEGNVIDYYKANREFRRASSAEGGCTSAEKFQELLQKPFCKQISEREIECVYREASSDKYEGNTFIGLLFHEAKKLINDSQ